MRLYRLLAIIAMIAVPFLGMAQTDVDENEDENQNQNEDGNWKYIESPIYFDSASERFSVEYERENDSYIYIDSLHPGEEYIYVTEYEEEKHIWDRVITRLLKTSVDTNYITTNDYGLQVKLNFNMFDGQTMFRWDPISDTLSNYCTITSDPIFKIGFWLGYRNFGLGYSFDLRSFSKDKTQYNSEFSFSYYGDAWGADLSFSASRGNKISFNRLDDIPTTTFSIYRAQINSYYALRYRKFSYNAAFSHSMRQEKSAGSPLFGLSFTGYYHYSPSNDLPRIVSNEDLVFPTSIIYLSMNLNAGYAHNFVTKKHTLLHISAMPYITILKKEFAGVNEDENLVDEDLDPIFQNGVVARASWIWQRENHLISLYGSINFNNLLYSPIETSDMAFRVGTCYGFRAYKHHKPHKKRRILRRRAP